jgi:hypothetical protein
MGFKKPRGSLYNDDGVETDIFYIGAKSCLLFSTIADSGANRRY